jgi:hypothetical protein
MPSFGIGGQKVYCGQLSELAFQDGHQFRERRVLSSEQKRALAERLAKVKMKGRQS